MRFCSDYSALQGAMNEGMVCRVHADKGSNNLVQSQGGRRSGQETH